MSCRGVEAAEELLRQGLHGAAAELLASLLYEQGRTEEAAKLYHAAAKSQAEPELLEEALSRLQAQCREPRRRTTIRAGGAPALSLGAGIAATLLGAALGGAAGGVAAGIGTALALYALASSLWET